ncbi:MAG: galactose-1-epimerase, partial [Oscillospiraceae bacterium]|nr:galactose-1-epimerase [Oscillospiraceae bacterium]
KPIEKRTGLCLETQFYPNSLKHKNFAQPIIDKGEIYHHVTTYRFGVEK